MPDYLNKNGETYTEQELIGYAEEENLTLEEAKEHCNNPETSGIDWFDGYTKQL